MIIATFSLNSVWRNYFKNQSHYFYEKDEVRNEDAYSSRTATSLRVNNDNKEINVNSANVEFIWSAFQ